MLKHAKLWGTFENYDCNTCFEHGACLKLFSLHGFRNSASSCAVLDPHQSIGSCSDAKTLAKRDFAGPVPSEFLRFQRVLAHPTVSVMLIPRGKIWPGRIFTHFTFWNGHSHFWLVSSLLVYLVFLHVHIVLFGSTSHGGFSEIELKTQKCKKWYTNVARAWAGKARCQHLT